MFVRLLSAQDLTQSVSQHTNTVIVGDSWEVVKHLSSESIQSIITSPPYFGHRNYSGHHYELKNMEFGQEQQLSEYVEKLVELFTELRRTLKPNGTLWLNLGDTYRNNQLLGIPWRVALSLQDSGWILRSEIIWNKPNAMPSSVKNRPTTSHETIFLFSKTTDYYYNADAIREPHVTFSDKSKMRGGRNHFGKRDGTPERGKNSGNPNLHNGRWDQAFHPLGRNKRTVWSISLGKFREAHFAVFPQELVETCLLAGSAENDLILDPFLGSGTTALVAQQHNRQFIGIELVPEYATMAINRLRNLDAKPKLF
ncbi:MAG: site-specific DNA-methyltransferase [Anaerolineae bacterium]|jgi:site-specific DNA-methyltransferase (adenine-specific)|nr:site-specific DNA-methyltransferase [Anaerolineae bacterium]